MAGLGWIHFSDTTRKQVLKIIDLLGDAGAIDELGVGVVRNAFSNEMFRGITTIMTRARYFYFVPYLLIDYLREKPKEPVSNYMNRAEMDLLEELTQHSENPEKDRIIGHTLAQKNLQVGRRKQELVRKPSEIYWGGIRQYGIFKKLHSFRQLCDAINKGNYINKPRDNRGSDSETGDDNPDFEKWAEIFDVPYKTNWNRRQIELTKDEAEHLREKVIETQNEKLVAELLKHQTWVEEFLEVKEFKDLLKTSFYKQLDPHNQKVIKTAVQFWFLLYGAHIRFNILLQQKIIQKEKVDFTNKWKEWIADIENSFNWDDFDRQFMWSLTYEYSQVKYGTRFFIDKWIDQIQARDYLNKIEQLDILVRNQEEKNKGDRSKLKKSHTEIYSGWVGIDRLDYRLGYAQTILRDITTSLGKE